MRNKRQFCGDPYRPQYEPESINHIIDTANKNGFIVTLNHLNWSKEPYEKFSLYKGMLAMEIFNTDCYMSGIDEVNGALYDEMLRLGNKIYCVAADDNHNHRPLDDPRSDSFGGYVMIKADSLTYKDIFSALEKGNFYSSRGPEIKSLYLENGHVYIETDDAKSIRFLTANRYSGLVMAEEGKTVNKASFNAERVHGYFRIEVENRAGEKAYTNAYFKEDFESFL